MKRKKRLALLASLVCCLTLVLFLPNFLSIDLISHWLLQHLGAQNPGAVVAGSCSIGWRQGLQCQDLTYEDTDKGVTLSIPELKGDKGLLALLVAPRYLGAIRVDRPVLTIASEKPRGALRKSVEKNNDQEKQALPWWERKSLLFQVHGGKIFVAEGQLNVQELARAAELQGSLSEGTIRYELSFLSGWQKGQVQAEGEVNLPTVRQNFWESFISSTKVEVKGVQLSAFFDLAAARVDFPRGEGLLDASFFVNTAGMESLKIKGKSALTNLKLAGGILGSDHPSFDKITFEFNGSRGRQDGWRLHTLALQSDPVTLQAKGQYDQVLASLNAEGVLHLPVLASHFPALLGVDQDTIVKEGDVAFTLDVTGKPHDLTMNALCRSKQLTAFHQGHELKWTTPLSIVTKASRLKGKTRVQHLLVKTPFLTAQGQGAAEDFSLKGQVNIEEMSQQWNQLFSYDLHGQGHVKFSLQSTLTEDEHIQLDTSFDSPDFALFQEEGVFLPPHPVHLNIEADLQPSVFKTKKIPSLQLTGDCWPGTFALSLGSLTQTSQGISGDFLVSGELQLQRLQALAKSMHLKMPTWDLSGVWQGESSGIFKQQHFEIQRLSGSITDFVVQNGTGSHKEKQLSLALEEGVLPGSKPMQVAELVVATDWQDFTNQKRPFIVVDSATHTLHVRGLTLRKKQAIMQGELRITNWQQPEPVSTGEVLFQGDGALISSLVNFGAKGSNGLQLQGKTTATYSFQSGGETKHQGTLALQVAPCVVFQGPKELYRGRYLQSKMAWSQKDGDKTISVPQVQIHTATARIDGRGQLREKNGKPMLELRGGVQPDARWIQELLSPAAVEPLQFELGKGGAFYFSSPLQMPFTLKQTFLVVKLPLHFVEYAGIRLENVTVPLRISQGAIRTSVQGPFAGGKVSFSPQWTYQTDAPRVEATKSELLLTDVTITPAFSRAFLRYLHPLFGTLAKPKGKIDLRIKELSWPLVDKNPAQEKFLVTLGVGKLSFQPTGILSSSFALCGIQQKEFTVKEQKVNCSGKAGEIVCDPVHIMAGSREIALQGSLGQSGALDFSLALPLVAHQGNHEQVTDEGASPAPELVEKMFSARIGGKLSKPIFDVTMLRSQIQQYLDEIKKQQQKKNEGDPVPDPS